MKWTLRRNGHIRTNMRVTYFIPKDLVDFIMANSSQINTEAAAMRVIKANLHDFCDAWRHITVDEDGDVHSRSVDDDIEGDVQYDGPEIAWKTPK